MTKDTQLSIRLRSETREALQALADADKRKLSAYIELVLDEHVTAKAKPRRK